MLTPISFGLKRSLYTESRNCANRFLPVKCLCFYWRHGYRKLKREISWCKMFDASCVRLTRHLFLSVDVDDTSLVTERHAIVERAVCVSGIHTR